MRRILIVTLFISLLFGSSIDKKIRQKKRELELKQTQYNRMDKKLSTIAKQIIDAKAESKRLDRKLRKLEKKIQDTQSIYDNLNSKKVAIDEELRKLNDIIEDKQDKFISLVADKFSMSLVLEELKQPTPKSIMLQEAYKIYAKENNKEIEKLQNDIKRLNAKEEFFKEKQIKLEKEIDIYKKDREEYSAKKEQKEQIIKRLARDRAIYKKRFNAIRESRRALQKKLAKLEIIRQDSSGVVEDRKRGKRYSSYRRRRRTTYSGGKTISPIEGSKLIKKFGRYIDPIYKFKIFNKSITLKAPHKGSKVRSVLSGKIVFAENSGGMLGKVVIVSHDNNIHTIYAKLSRLAPGIHVGKRVSKGSIIGKVNSTLMFEVTKNNKHLNPLKLIRL
jgi:murein DD-endopeptidase MepM/ murein hydrolase activator NlpD